MTHFITQFTCPAYHYVEKVSEQFSKTLGLKSPIHLSLTAHGDKARQYKNIAQELNVPYGKLLLVYLLSYEYGWLDQVRQTENGWVPIEDWLVEKLTKDQQVMDVLNSLPTIVSVKDERSDEGEFEVFINGNTTCKCRREDPVKGGLWLVFNKNNKQVDRDRYSNDIIERAGDGRYEKD